MSRRITTSCCRLGKSRIARQTRSCSSARSSASSERPVWRRASPYRSRCCCLRSQARAPSIALWSTDRCNHAATSRTSLSSLSSSWCRRSTHSSTTASASSRCRSTLVAVATSRGRNDSAVESACATGSSESGVGKLSGSCIHQFLARSEDQRALKGMTPTRPETMGGICNSRSRQQFSLACQEDHTIPAVPSFQRTRAITSGTIAPPLPSSLRSARPASFSVVPDPM